MKPQHDKVPKEEFTPGERYNVALRNQPLYEATVVKFHGGCWATVRVERALSDATASLYPVGSEFDIKVAEYEVTRTA